MAELLRYFKHTQKKDNLDTGTLPDPDGLLSRDILCSSIGITNIHVYKVQQEASSDRLQEPNILLTTQKFYIGVFGSYQFTHTAGILIRQYFTC